MKLFVGLGNPGAEYENTRHNVGFLLVDALVRSLGGKFAQNNKLQGQVAKVGETVFLKPTTFMNETGRSVRAVSQYFQIEPTEITVVYDDLDLAIGTHKIQQAKFPKQHNGVNSVIQHLGTSDFRHIRIGIDGRNQDRKMPSDRYVLQNFSQEEFQQLQTVIEEVVSTLLA